MKDFVEFINEANDSSELKRLKSLVKEIEVAEASKNKSAINAIWQALYNFNDSMTMDKHIQAYKKAMGK